MADMAKLNGVAIKSFLVDISGVLFDNDSEGGKAIKGSVKALQRYCNACVINQPYYTISAKTCSFNADSKKVVLKCYFARMRRI